MPRMGRPREKNKHMPAGMRLVDRRWYWRPTNDATRALRDLLWPGRSSVPAGGSADEAREWWAANVLPKLKDVNSDAAIDVPAPGTAAEIIKRYLREIVPTLPDVTANEAKRYCATLEKHFGARRYAGSEAEAAAGKGTYLRTLDITRYLRSEENQKRPVAANREIQCFSRMFTTAKSLWGYTEYNPCLQAMYNDEAPRSVYIDDRLFMKVYECAAPWLQCMMDLAQMHGARRGMLLKMNLSNLTPDGVLLPLNKKRRNDPQRYQLIKWVDEAEADTGLRAVIDRALELRAAVRGGQREIADLDTAPLFLNRKGKRVTVTGFNSQWQRARAAAGFGKHEFHFHDIKAKSLSDSKDEIDAMNRGGHVDIRMAKTVYRRKPTEVIPLPRVSAKPKKAG